MKKKRKFSIFPAYIDKHIIIAITLLYVFGTIMIISTEMGLKAGDQSVVFSTVGKQFLYYIAGIITIIFISRYKRVLSFDIKYIWFAYGVILFSLLMTRAFPAINGAHAWIWIGTFTVQPSEFAKVMVMILGAKLFGYNPYNDFKKSFLYFVVAVGVYFITVLSYQHDLGSAVIIAGISYIMLLIVPYKELNQYRKVMLLLLALGIVGAIFVLSPIGTKLFEHFSDSYMAGRFLAAANPFAYQYDTGYHLIMGLVSFATGGWFGVGLGNSIHKYMNFPNSPSDFILPIIVEELGIVFGLLPILIGYGVIFWRLIKHSLKFNNVASKMILVGTFAYLALHFVLNVGGVGGFIPLTGVPLLLISRGGSSVVGFMMAIGFCEREIIHNIRKEKENENNSGKI